MSAPASFSLLDLPWLWPQALTIDQAINAKRLPQALLLLGVKGSGKRVLSEWLAKRLLCQKPKEIQGLNFGCDDCAACHLYTVDTHPDLSRVLVAEDKKQISIEDIRKLIGQMSLKANLGGFKLALIDPADALNVNGANALLKTLEEPPPNTLLMMCLTRLERLPATIASRCQRVALPLPERDTALLWLNGHSTRPDWPQLLQLAGGAPLLALDYMSGGAADVLKDMSKIFDELRSPQVDLIALAERAQGHYPLERLRWLEQWVNDKINQALHSAKRLELKGWFELGDELKRAVVQVQGTLNVQMIFERIYLKLGQELARELRAR
jgi:DNA polymerase III subunit delta'